MAKFDIICGKGTYIRTLCHDLGQAIGCGACMKSLRRTKCGQWTIDAAIGFDAALALTKSELIGRIIPMHKMK